MYRKIIPQETTISRNESYIGERLEEKIERIVNNKEPITDGAPLIYTERKDGVLPAYDIRTDRFEIAVEAMDKVTKSHLAKREQRLKAVKGGDQGEGKEGIGGAEPIQAT